MGQDSKKDNGAQNKPAMENVDLAQLAQLPAGAADAGGGRYRRGGGGGRAEGGRPGRLKRPGAG